MGKLKSILNRLSDEPEVKQKGGDHKRKARPIATATVTVEPGCITVVVPDVLGKNASHKTGKGGRRFKSEQTTIYRASVEAAVAPLRTGGAGLQVLVMSGAWRLEVLGVWPTKRDEVKGRPVDFLMANGDADAAIPQALDALQHAGILDDDARVVEVRAWNLYRKGVRATVIRLVRVLPVSSLDAALPMGDRYTERDAAIAHLLPLVPASPEPPAKLARKRKVKPCA